MKIGSPWRMHKQISWNGFWSLFFWFWCDYCIFFRLTNSQVNFWTLNSDVIKKVKQNVHLEIIFPSTFKVDAFYFVVVVVVSFFELINRIEFKTFFLSKFRVLALSLTGKNVLWICFFTCVCGMLLIFDLLCLHFKCSGWIPERIFFFRWTLTKDVD